MTSENTNLSDEVRLAQDNLRLSANQMAKLNNELKITCNENEELKRMLNEQMGIGKKSHDQEEKIILLSAEIQRLRSGETEHEGTKKRLMEYEMKLAQLSQEFERLDSIIQELRK